MNPTHIRLLTILASIGAEGATTGDLYYYSPLSNYGGAGVHIHSWKIKAAAKTLRDAGLIAPTGERWATMHRGRRAVAYAITRAGREALAGEAGAA